MPLKQKLHKTTGKPKTLPKLPINSTPTTNSEPSTSSDAQSFDVNSEAARQFEVELCWCIQQLQIALKSGKLNQKQSQDNVKALNTLMSNSAPMIKKRQVMRLSFGDYRSAMAAEEKKHRSKVDSKAKIAPVTPPKASVFIKKSVFQQTGGNNFRFNFTPATGDSAEISDDKNDISNIISEKMNICDDGKTNGDNYKFVPSNNNFMFNFCIENADQ